jgi:hypothetical protein
MLVITKAVSDAIIDDLNGVVSVGLGYNGTEVVGGGYSRVSVGSDLFSYTSDDVTYYYYSNSSAITFPTATGSWGSINEIYFIDSSGSVVYTFVLDSAISIINGIAFSINQGGLVLKVKKSG